MTETIEAPKKPQFDHVTFAQFEARCAEVAKKLLKLKWTDEEQAKQLITDLERSRAYRSGSHLTTCRLILKAVRKTKHYVDFEKVTTWVLEWAAIEYKGNLPRS